MPYLNVLSHVTVEGVKYRTVDGHAITTVGLVEPEDIDTEVHVPPNPAEQQRANFFLRSFGKTRYRWQGWESLDVATAAAASWWSPRSVSLGAVILATVNLGWDLHIDGPIPYAPLKIDPNYVNIRRPTSDPFWQLHQWEDDGVFD